MKNPQTIIANIVATGVVLAVSAFMLAVAKPDIENALLPTKPTVHTQLTEKPSPSILQNIVRSAEATNTTITPPPPAPPTPPKASTPKQTETPKKNATSSCNGFAQQFLCLLNSYRTSNGKGKVVYDSAMSKVAFNYSQQMNQTGIFSHIDTSGGRFTDRCATAKVACLAENLAKNFNSATKLLSMWEASPTHNQNLLGDYTTIGLGVYGPYATLLLR